MLYTAYVMVSRGFKRIGFTIAGVVSLAIILMGLPADRVRALVPGGASVVGGEKGYVNPDRNEKAQIHVWASEGGKIRVRIFNLAGRRVWHAERGTTGAAEEIITWDCQYDGGGSVTAGVYIILVEGPGVYKKLAIGVLRK